MNKGFLALAAAMALTAGPPLEQSRPEAAPASMSEGAAALDEAFSQEFAEERRPDHVAFRYSRETWDLDWPEWWAYRQGEIDLDGLMGRIRIRAEGIAPAPPSAQTSEAKGDGLPLAWLAAGVGFLVLLATGVLVLILARKKGPGTLSTSDSPVAYPPPPPLPSPAPSAVLTSLTFHSGPLAGRSVPLGQGLRLGRESDCHVVLADNSVSRHHADLVPTPQGWVLRDLGSSNGTSVNGLRIQGEVLLRGDESLVFGVIRANLSAG